MTELAAMTHAVDRTALANMTETGRKLLAGMVRENAELDFKIKACTELYRKGFGRIALVNRDGTPFEGHAEIELKQQSHEYGFGANLFALGGFPNAEMNAQFEAIFPQFFNLAVVPFYWSGMEPEDGKLRFDKDCEPMWRRPATDLCVAYCQANGVAMKGHPLCWNQYLPSWLPLDRRQWMRRLERHFAEIGERYGDSIFIFDFINEAITALRNPNTPYPEGIVEMAYELGKKYFPGAQLVLNEDRQWWTYFREHTQFYLMVQTLLARGVRPGALGFQYHMMQQYFKNSDAYKHFTDAANLWRLLDLYGKFGLPCSLSEISIIGREDLLGPAAEEFQAIYVEKLYRLWFAHPTTESIIWWNPVEHTAAEAEVGDPHRGGNVMWAGLYNYDFSLKPAGEVVRRLVNEEWNTQTSIDYVPQGDNCFHGFYGTYAVKVKTSMGVVETTVNLSKFAPLDLTVAVDVA